MPGPRLKKIISGMQSGGDLFGLEAAQKLGIQTGGYGAGASGAVTKDSSGRNIEAPELRDKFGIAPANTTLRIGYRINTTDDVNAAQQTITNVDRPIVNFTSAGSLASATRSSVLNSLEVTNE